MADLCDLSSLLMLKIDLFAQKRKNTNHRVGYPPSPPPHPCKTLIALSPILYMRCQFPCGYESTSFWGIRLRWSNETHISLLAWKLLKFHCALSKINKYFTFLFEKKNYTSFGFHVKDKCKFSVLIVHVSLTESQKRLLLRRMISMWLD